MITIVIQTFQVCLNFVSVRIFPVGRSQRGVHGLAYARVRFAVFYGSGAVQRNRKLPGQIDFDADQRHDSRRREHSCYRFQHGRSYRRLRRKISGRSIVKDHWYFLFFFFYATEIGHKRCVTGLDTKNKK